MTHRPASPAALPNLSQGRVRAALAAILVLAALLRVLYLREAATAPDFATPAVDAATHDYWARGLAFGNWDDLRGRDDPRVQSTPYFRPPGYPYFLAGVYRLAGPGYLAPRIVQSALGLLTALLAFVAARRGCGDIAGLAAALLIGTYWAFIYYEGELLEPALLDVLVISIVVVLASSDTRRTLARFAAAGLLVGLAALVRPNVLVCIVAIFAWQLDLAARHGQWRRRILASGLAAIVALLAILPATIRNYRVAGEFVLISSNGGINLYIGNRPGADGFVAQQIDDLGDFRTCFDYPRLVARLEAKLGRPMSHAEVSRYFAGRAWDFIRSHPADAIGLTLRKAALFWGPREVSHNKVEELDRRASPLLSRIPGGFPWAFAGALAGVLLLALESRRRPLVAADARARLDHRVDFLVLLVAMTLCYFLSYLPFFAAARYRVVVVPLLLLIAACAVQRVVELAFARRFAAAVSAVAVFVVLGALASVQLVPFSPDAAQWHFGRGVAFDRSGRVRDAEAEYRRALEARPAFVDALTNLGALLFQQGRPAEAIPLLHSATQRDPHRFESCYALGSALLAAGNAPEAVARFQRAIELRPDSIDACVDLGVALMHLDRRNEAERAWRDVLTQKPDHYPALYNLAGLEMIAGRTDAAMELYRAAVRLDPMEQPAILNAIGAILNHGQPAAAEELLESVCRKRPNDARARVLLGDALAALGRSAEAAAAYREALRLDPADEATRRKLQPASAPAP